MIIQRIQTLYLLLATILVSMSLFMPLAFFATPDAFYDLYAMGLKDVDGVMAQSTIYMFILLALCAILPFFTIFVFKKPMLQIRLCAVECVLLVGANVMMGLYYFLSYRLFSDFEISTQGFKPALFLPLIAIPFCYLAAKAILRDVITIESIDRIR